LFLTACLAGAFVDFGVTLFLIKHTLHTPWSLLYRYPPQIILITAKE
jgi:hypothetical protein